MYNASIFTYLDLPEDWIRGTAALAVVGVPFVLLLTAWMYARVRAQQKIIALMVGGLGLAFIALHIHYFPLCTDDTFISLRYAENLARGEGLCFNPGERVEGFSNPLWVFAMAACAKLGLNSQHADYLLPLAAKLGGVIAHLALFVLFLAWVIRRNEATGLQAAGVIGAAWIVAAGSTTLWAVSGMETALHGLIVFLLALLWSDVNGKTGAPRFPRAYVFCAILLTLSRPEGALLALCAIGFWMLCSLRETGRVSRPAWLAMLLLLLVLILETAFRKIYFGDWLPNTFAAKMTPSYLFQTRRGLQYLGFGLLATGGWIWLAAAWYGLRSSTMWRSPAGALIVAQTVFIILVGGDWMPGFRFWAPVVPLGAILLVQLLREAEMQEVLARRVDSRRKIAMALLAGGFAFVLSMFGFDRVVVHQYSFSSTGFRELAIAPLAFHYDIAKRLREGIPADTKVAGGEAGLIPYITGARFVDCFGLVDREIARGPRQRLEIADAATILGRKPGYIVLGPVGQNMTGEWAVPGEYVNALRAHPDFARTYTELLRNAQFVVYERK